MTKEERKKAIDALKISAPVMAVTQEEFNDYIKTLNKIIDSLEQEPSDDAVSRQVVLDYIHRILNQGTGKKKSFEFIQKYVEKLPSVNPKETVTEFADRCCECGKMRKGHWILQSSNKDQGERNFIWWKCSECGQVIYSGAENDRREYHVFCGRCGAKMEDDIEPKTGHWIIMGDMYIKCSECGHITKTESPDIYNFCMVCGVKMSKDVIWYDKRNYSEIVVELQKKRNNE